MVLHYKKFVFFVNPIIAVLLFCIHLLSYQPLYNLSAKNSAFNANIAVNNDVNTIWSNPSNIDHLSIPQVSFTYGILNFGLHGSEYLNSVNNLEPVLAEQIFSVGASLKKLGYTGFGFYRFSLGNFYIDEVFLISYGKKIFQKILVGGDIKIFYRQYGKDFYTETYSVFSKGYSKTDFTIDLSFTYKIFDNTNFAIMLHNIKQPNLSLLNVEEDKLPLVLRTGVGLNLQNCKFGCELSYEFLAKTSDETKFFVSGEYTLLKWLKSVASLSVGTDNYYNFSSGIILNLTKTVTLNYCLIYPITGLKNVFTHKVGIDVLFYPPKEKEKSVEQVSPLPQKEEKEIKKEELPKEKKKLRLRIKKTQPKLKNEFEKPVIDELQNLNEQQLLELPTLQLEQPTTE